MYYPDYFKTKIELENEKFISKLENDILFEENYKNSDLYKKLVKLAMAEDEIYEFMKLNQDSKYNSLKKIYNAAIKSCIDLCELIDYIGHYPTTYPVPTEEEKNVKMEQLLEEYDIMVRYHLGDIDEMQIMSDDVVRIIEKLENNLSIVSTIKQRVKEKDWRFTRKMSEADRKKCTDSLIYEINEFPLSFYQKKNQSIREEGKKYLRLQHGKNII